MAYTIQALTTVALTFALSVAGVRWFLGWLSSRGFVADENDRTMHSGRIPQGGGVPVLLSIIAVMALAWGDDVAMNVLLAAAFGLAILSGANDRRAIAFPWRLASHVAAAGLAIAVVIPGASVFGGWLPIGLDRAVTLVALVWFINLTNFMDGIDGNAGVQTISVAVGSLLVLGTQFDFAYDRAEIGNFDGLAFALIGASAGFLVWNWHTARVFLGDAGSIPLGLLMGMMLVHVATTVSMASAVILPLYYVTDATRTLLMRFWRGEKVWQPHRLHVYQRAARSAQSHSAVVVRIGTCNIVLILAAILAVEMPVLGLGIGVASVAVLLWVLEGIAAELPPNGRVAAGDVMPAQGSRGDASKSPPTA